MSTETKDGVYAKIDENLKKKTKSQAVLIGIDYKDYISLALRHYSEHIEKEEINFDDELFSK